MAFIVIYITHGSKEAAEQLTQPLVEKRFVACANIFPINSAYWWKGAVQQEGEWVSIVKTITENWEAVKLETKRLHPYDVPCIMKWEVEANDSYEAWIRESVDKQ